MELYQAKKIAQTIAEILLPDCEILHIAGSIRRQKPQVKDIEIVCLAKKQNASQQQDLFGTTASKQQPIGDFATIVNGLGKIIKGNPNGKYMQIQLMEGINLDLFMPDAFDYYRQLAIRTGSADYAAKVIATGWRKIGWCGSDVGLRRITDCTEKKDGQNKSIWKCTNPQAQLPPVWTSEEDFFHWIKVKWMPPYERNV